MRGISDMKSRPRKSQSTIRDRQAIYDEILEKSMEWFSYTNQELADECTKLATFSVSADRSREYLLRYLFLLNMKRMIS